MMVGASGGFEGFDQLIRWVAVGIESIAIGIIVVGAITTTIIFLVRVIKEGSPGRLLSEIPQRFWQGHPAGSGISHCFRYRRHGGGWPHLPGSGDIGAFGSNPNLPEFFPGTGDHRTLALAN